MGKPKTLRPPSRVDALPFPVFGLTWYGSACSSNVGSGSVGGGGGSSGAGGGRGGGGCSVIAYCGGGGSAKTGVGNKIVVLLTTATATIAADDDDHGTDNNGATSTSTTVQERQIEISTGDALCFGVHAFCPPKNNVKSSSGEVDEDDNDDNNMVRLLACVGDEILLYGIPLVTMEISTNATSAAAAAADDAQHQQNQEEEKNEPTAMSVDNEAILLGKTNVGNSYGASVASYSTLLCRTTPGKLIHCIAVGCENGTIVIFHLHQHQHHQKSTTTRGGGGGGYQYEFT